MNPKEILQSIIDEFKVEKFNTFFRAKNDKLRYPNEHLDEKESNFTEGLKLAEGELDDGEIIVCSFKVLHNLTERSGKKAQYNLGKKILKKQQADAGIFIFYDQQGNFRFSLIYTNYLGKNRDWNNFRRFTYFVSKDWTNKTFLSQIGDADFSTIEKIKEAFSVEPVTKQFYNEIQNWYFWAMDKIKFPDDYKYSDNSNKDKEIRNATNLIRLITRIIFIWFIKEKGLVPVDLFSKEKLTKIVKDFLKDKNSSNFYNAILQNLFFATLNQKIDKRKFTDERGYPYNKKEYGIKNLYRYEDKFIITKTKILELFKDIPFLNGGLFDCLDKEDETGKVIYIDGFSRNKNKTAIVPDYLFFKETEEKVDLSIYGLGTNKSVRGLFEILNSYNFTIDENTPIDQEIALDPELLGKVFENLLASYNPETATTARKATGSYYTPREIVDYMVEASLCEYLKTKLPEINEEKIKLLLSYSENIPEFSEEEKQKIISSIDKIKILDPACGSGAFPMGILHKLVFVLQRLDPENKHWKELQYQKAIEEIDEILKLEDKKVREERLKEINEIFDENMNYPDYARKLYLIENCIYGVDIQPIAIQISKLRFFISLVLDQKIDKSKENFGIRALPNLETKFVAANTLIGLEIPQEDLLFQNTEVKQIQDKLAKERHKYFNTKTRSEKISYQKQDKILREKLANKVKEFLTEQKRAEINQTQKIIAEEELKLQKTTQEPEDIEIIEQPTLFGETEKIIIDHKKEKIKDIKLRIKNLNNKLKDIQEQLKGDFVIRIARKIANFDLYDQNTSADWFDPEWMFGVKDGFDIVIGNPPHGADISGYLKKLESLYKNYDSRKNSASFFISLTDKLLKLDGISSYIIPKSLTYVDGWNRMIDFVLKHNCLLLILDISKSFENVLLEQVVVIYKKVISQDNYKIKIGSGWDKSISIIGSIKKEFVEQLNIIPCHLDSHKLKILLKLQDGCIKLSSISKTFRGLPWQRKISKTGEAILRGKNIGRFFLKDNIDNIKLSHSEKDNKKVLLLKQKKIISQNIVAHVMNPYDRIIIMATIDKEGTLTLDTCMNTFLTNSNFSYEYILSILNSKLASWYYYWFVYNRAIRTMHFDEHYIGKLPVKVIPLDKQKVFIALVDKILAITKDEDYLNNPEKQAKVKEYERQIDQLVYKLYGLTEEEIKIIEDE